MAALYFAVTGKNSKEMVPKEEILKAEIRCIQKQRLNTLRETYDILYAKFQSSEIGREMNELQQKKDTYQQPKAVQEELARIKAETRHILREKYEETKKFILKIVLANKEIESRREIKANENTIFVFAKPKSVREMFPKNLEDEFERKSVIHHKRPAVSKIIAGDVFVRVTESVFLTNRKDPVAAAKDTTITQHTSYKQDTVVIKSNGLNHVSIRSSELEIQHTTEPSTNSRCSNMSMHPTNFQKYDYIKSLEATKVVLKQTPPQNQFSGNSLDTSMTPLESPSTDISPKRKIATNNSQNKVDILSVDIIKSADLPIADRFSRYLDESPLSGVFTISQERTSNEPRVSSKSSLDVDMEAGKTANQRKGSSNNIDLDSGTLKNLPEYRAAKNNQSKPGPSHSSLENVANNKNAASSNNFNFDTGEYNIKKENGQTNNIPKNKESANIQPKPGPSNNIQKAPAQTSLLLSSPEPMESFNFENMSKEFNFSNESNFNLEFTFNEDQELNLDNSLQMDCGDNGFCFGADSTDKDGNEDFFHF